jgi:hypothetical protein
MTSFRVHSFFGLMNRLPYLLLGSLALESASSRWWRGLALQLHVTHHPARRNPAFFESLSNRALRLLLMPGQTAKRHSASRAISGNPKSSDVSLANHPSSRIPGVSISHAPPGSAVNIRAVVR